MTADLDRDINEIWTLLFTMVLDAEKRLAGYMAEHNLTPPQFYVLKTLVEQGGRCPIGEIARAHHLTNATMTGLVKRLEAMQPPLVVREQHVADRRSVIVILTPEGQARFLAVQTTLLEQLKIILSLLAEDERKELMRYMSRYVALVAGSNLAELS